MDIGSVRSAVVGAGTGHRPTYRTHAPHNQPVPGRLCELFSGRGRCARGQMSASVSHKRSSSDGGRYLCLQWHSSVVGSGCCGSGLRTGIGLAGAPSADESESPLVMGMTSGRGMGLATSLDCRGLWLW